MSAKKILLIEDSATQAILFQSILEEDDLDVTWVTSGEEAITFLESRRPDMIISDYHLPGIQADELCRDIRMNLSTQDIPIMMLTADESLATRLAGLESGADDYLSKNVDAEHLRVRVQAHLARAHSNVSLDFLVNLNLRNARILVIDDSTTYALYLAEHLQKEGFEIETASSGEEGLEAAGQHDFDCIVIDVVMPGINGIHVCRELHADRQENGKDVVLIVVSNLETRENVIDAMRAGADEFLTKSTDIVLMCARIRGLLRRQFLRAQNRQISAEFRNKELEAVAARARQETAEAQAALAEELEARNKELASANAELKDLQSHLVHTVKMASLGELVAGIAHEVNNPLAYSVGHLHTVSRLISECAERCAQDLPPDIVAKLDKAKRRVKDSIEGLERVKELVIKLRTFSRLDEGEFKHCDMVENIESTLTLLSYRLPETVRIEKSFASDNHLYCAPAALNQVVMNLVANAIDAIEGEGVVRIETRRDAGHYTIVVSDTGPGVPEELKDRIFEPFFTTKDVGSGTGLGLSISYKIVTNHDGRLQVRTAEGGGAQFEISIPLSQEVTEHVS